MNNLCSLLIHMSIIFSINCVTMKHQKVVKKANQTIPRAQYDVLKLLALSNHLSKIEKNIKFTII